MPRKYYLRAGQTMGTQKPRILPWLISQLYRGELEGVAWLGESRTRFRIPWKHGLRQDAQQEDFGIFQVRAGGEGPSPSGAGRGGPKAGGAEKAGLAHLELPGICVGWWKWVELELEREKVVGSADWCGRAVRIGVSWFWE